MTSSKPKPNQPCPCGSGKKYRDCHASNDKRRQRLTRQTRKAALWIVAIAVVGTVIYFYLSNNVAYGQRALSNVVDLSGLTPAQRQTALKEANAARCTCGCHLGLAECLVTDVTCPIRTDNIDRIRAMAAAVTR